MVSVHDASCSVCGVQCCLSTQVLTFNVASALCVLNAEKALDDISDSGTISFQEYLNFLRVSAHLQN